MFDAAIVTALGDARRELDPVRGEMVRVVWLSGVRNTGRLLLVIHHLAVDGVSWRVLVPELASAFHRIDAGEEPEPSYSGTSVRRWSHALRDIAPDRRVELPRWRSILEGADPLIGTRPLDPRLDTFDSVGRVVADVPVELSDTVLTTLPALFGGSVNDGPRCCSRTGTDAVEAGTGHTNRQRTHLDGGPRTRSSRGARCGRPAHGRLVHQRLPDADRPRRHRHRRK